MDNAVPWFEDKTFWLNYAPYMFNDQRWSAAPEEVDNIIKLLSLNPGDRVLDLCCGVGRHSVSFAEKGLSVTGVDLTEPFLEAAEETARDRELSIEFIRADMRLFERSNTFDAVVNLFTSFGYFETTEEEAGVLSHIHSSLKDGGKILIELMGKEILSRLFLPRDWYQEEETLVLMEREVFENWERIKNRWILIRGNNKTEYVFSHRLYSAFELMSLLEKAGFSQLKAYGDFDGSPYDEKASRLIVTGSKHPNEQTTN